MKQANAKQKQWMKDITEWAEDNIQLVYGVNYFNANIQRHHVLGRSAKHNKVEIGHWFILPIPFELHDVSSNHPENVTHRKKAFVKRFGDQRSIFQVLYAGVAQWGYDVPSIEIYNAIMDTTA